MGDLKGYVRDLERGLHICNRQTQEPLTEGGVKDAMCTTNACKETTFGSGRRHHFRVY